RQRDHGAAKGDLLQHLLGDPEPEDLGNEQVRIDQGRLPQTLAAYQPVPEGGHRNRAHADQDADRLAAFLPDQDAEHDAAHAQHRQDRADDVDLPWPGVGHVLNQFDAGQHDRDDDHLQQEADPPGQIG